MGLERRWSWAFFRDAQLENERQWLQAAARLIPVGLIGKTLPGLPGQAQEQDALRGIETSTFMGFHNLRGRRP